MLQFPLPLQLLDVLWIQVEDNIRPWGAGFHVKQWFILLEPCFLKTKCDFLRVYFNWLFHSENILMTLSLLAELSLLQGLRLDD